MSINPDIPAHEEAKKEWPEIPDRVPIQFELRFIECDDKRILQQYQWCYQESRFGWYDIPMVTE